MQSASHLSFQTNYTWATWLPFYRVSHLSRRESRGCQSPWVLQGLWHSLAAFFWPKGRGMDCDLSGKTGWIVGLTDEDQYYSLIGGQWQQSLVFEVCAVNVKHYQWCRQCSWTQESSGLWVTPAKKQTDWQAGVRTEGQIFSLPFSGEKHVCWGQSNAGCIVWFGVVPNLLITELTVIPQVIIGPSTTSNCLCSGWTVWDSQSLFGSHCRRNVYTWQAV